MADMLIRGIPNELKRELAIRAAENGRSQNAETVAILESALKPEKENWVLKLMEVAQECGGVELELPERTPAREFAFGE